jgi:hypothetical protein
VSYNQLGTVGSGSVLSSTSYNQLIANNVVGHPTLTTTQRTTLGGTLTTGDTGTMVYDTTLNQFYMWNGTSWVAAFWPVVNGSALAITGTAGITGAATALSISVSTATITSATVTSGTVTNTLGMATASIGTATISGGATAQSLTASAITVGAGTISISGGSINLGAGTLTSTGALTTGTASIGTANFVNGTVTTLLSATALSVTGNATATSLTVNGTAGFTGLATANGISAATASFSGSVVTGPNSVFVSPVENVSINTAQITGPVTLPINNYGYYLFNNTSGPGGSYAINITGPSTILTVGQSITVTFAVYNAGTPYLPSAYQIDGLTANVNIYWSNGVAPSQVDTNTYDIYTFSIIKTATGPNTYTVFAQQSKF